MNHFANLKQNRLNNCSDIVIFWFLKTFRGRRCITVLNFVKNWSNSCWSITIFRFFKMAANRHLGFVCRVSGPPMKHIWWSLLVCKIWLEWSVLIAQAVLLLERWQTDWHTHTHTHTQSDATDQPNHGLATVGVGNSAPRCNIKQFEYSAVPVSSSFVFEYKVGLLQLFWSTGLLKAIVFVVFLLF